MTGRPEKLLAKARRNGRELSLERHLRETEEAAQLIFRLDKRWGKNWCRFFKLNDAETQKRFLLNLRVAGLFHDIGKANEDFYRAVTNGMKDSTQSDLSRCEDTDDAVRR
jgi:CRISPR-associated endonuclease/helicase Cas3